MPIGPAYVAADRTSADNLQPIAGKSLCMHKDGHIALGYDYVIRHLEIVLNWEHWTVSRQGRPWTLPGPRRVPPQVDIRKPSVARVYDAILGGKDNFPWDRAVAAEVIAAFPQAATSAMLNRQVLERAVRYLHDQGIDQFLDLGSGLPTARNTHEIAQRAQPGGPGRVRGQRPHRAHPRAGPAGGRRRHDRRHGRRPAPGHDLEQPRDHGVPRLQPPDRARAQRGHPPPQRR